MFGWQRFRKHAHRIIHTGHPLATDKGGGALSMCLHIHACARVLKHTMRCDQRCTLAQAEVLVNCWRLCILAGDAVGDEQQRT
eukprot:1160209-Pelagomonas_calceolata.AAC.2